MALSAGTVKTYASGGAFAGIKAYPSDGLFGGIPLLLIECITVTFLAQSIVVLTFTETIATLAFAPETGSSLLFTPLPSAALTWLATDSALNFLNPIEPELTFNAVTSCPTS